MAAFVLGNGVSREAADVNDLLELGAVYGCNAIYRTHQVTVLVATDQPIARAIQDSGYPKNNRFYTRRPIPGLGAIPVPKEYFGYSSGPIATALAAQDRNRRIYLLGFDMGPNQDRFNNVYAGTEFYKPVGAVPTYTGNWVRQIQRVIKDYPNIEFMRVCGATTARISELENISNLAHLDLATFLERINNRKDL